MKAQLLSDWPVASWCIPAGTFLNGNDLQWNGIPLSLPLPLTVRCLDAEAANHLSATYPNSDHLIQGVQPTK